MLEIPHICHDFSLAKIFLKNLLTSAHGSRIIPVERKENMRTNKTKTSKKANRKEKKHIIVLLDETGSMSSRMRETIDGYNKHLEQSKKDHPGARFTLTRFNSEKIDNSIIDVEINKVNPLDDYRPSAMTPLYDAIGKTMKFAEGYSGKVIFAIITDGEENYSREFEREQIFDKIREFEKKGWLFVYLGVNVDAWGQASSIGINPSMAVSYASIGKVFRCSNTTYNAYFSGKKVVLDKD